MLCFACSSMDVLKFNLCKVCYQGLIQKSRAGRDKINSISKNGQKIQSLALFEWEQDKQKILTLLLKNLKGGTNKKLVEDLSSSMSILFLSKYKSHNFDFVAYPPSKNGKSDHASSLALAVARKIGLPVIYGIMAENVADNQKNKTIVEREKLRYLTTEKISCKKLLIIDDIVTTGATARALSRAVGAKRSLALSVAYRRHQSSELL